MDGMTSANSEADGEGVPSLLTEGGRERGGRV